VSETDVTKTLNEIRERVRVHLRAQMRPSENESSPPVVWNPNTAIESLRANLAVIERSRNKLPPVTSYRKGWLARLELSVKRLLKRITHWFTWEQVNFNAATSNSLEDVLVVLASHEEVLAEMRAQLEKLASVATELQQGKFQGGHFDNGSPASYSSATGSAPVDEDRQSEVDLEINKLAARLEELRKAKTR